METAAAEAAGSIAASRHEQQQQQQVANTALPVLDVVRALHQTVVSLRTKLDQSRAELQRLKESTEESEQQQQGGPDYSGDKSSAYSETVGRLALENHVLRRRLIERAGEFSSDASTSPPPPSQAATLASEKQLPEESATMEAAETNEPEPTEPQATGDEESTDAAAASAPDAPTTPTTPSGQDEVDAGATSKPADEVDEEEEEEEEEEQSNPGANNETAPEQQPAANKLSSQGVSNESENESEELDDIQLIFTTEETCRDVGLQEDLVSITDTENWQAQQARTPSDQHKSALKIGQAKSADGEPSMSHVCNGRGGNAGMATGEKASSVDEAASSQSSSIDREESVDRFDESSSSRLNKLWSQCSVLVETDISKCGVLEEADISARHNVARRNTLAAPPAAYRPIIHREALAAGRRKSAAPLRPVMDRAGPGGGRRESGAQTDISALPAQWRSESYLAHKVAHTFTTLPSKFALPAGVAGRLRLSDKTREARRVMLSDISFTSMVPELSRSADHLCHDPHSQFPQPHCYSSRGGAGVATCGGGGGGGGVAGAGLRTPEANRRESWARSGAGLPSPCECRLSTDLYSTRYRGSLSSIPSPAGACGDFGPSRRHSWRPNAAASFDGWRAPAVVPGSREAMMGGSGGGSCGGSGHQLARPTWSSMPSSPTHVQPPSAALVARLSGSPRRRTSSRVTFQECPMMIRGSLPNLRSDPLAENSGESTETESLIDEAEDYLRRSIDSMLTISTATADAVGRHAARRRRARRHSEPDLFREWQAPQDARPYLPKIPRDLKLDHLVKVISPEGRILQGRVRYVGPVAGREDVHVGVELPNDTAGTSDGTFHGRRYFDCEPDRAVFVPFKKVVLAWCTTT